MLEPVKSYSKWGAVPLMLPAIIIVLWHMVFISLGVAALWEDQALRSDTCGWQYHTFKYVVLDITFALFALGSFFIFPGGGEGARARATLLLILHFAFAVWGYLMRTAYSPTCKSVLEHKFTSIDQFQEICIMHNSLLACLMLMHEVFSHRLDGDHTIIFEVSRHPAPFLDPRDQNGAWLKSPAPGTTSAAPQKMGFTEPQPHLGGADGTLINSNAA